MCCARAASSRSDSAACPAASCRSSEAPNIRASTRSAALTGAAPDGVTVISACRITTFSPWPPGAGSGIIDIVQDKTAKLLAPSRRTRSRSWSTTGWRSWSWAWPATSSAASHHCRRDAAVPADRLRHRAVGQHRCRVRHPGPAPAGRAAHRADRDRAAHRPARPGARGRARRAARGPGPELPPGLPVHRCVRAGRGGHPGRAHGDHALGGMRRTGPALPAGLG